MIDKVKRLAIGVVGTILAIALLLWFTGEEGVAVDFFQMSFGLIWGGIVGLAEFVAAMVKSLL